MCIKYGVGCFIIRERGSGKAYVSNNSSSLTLFLLGSAAFYFNNMEVDKENRVHVASRWCEFRDMREVDTDYLKLLDHYCALSHETKRLYALINEAYEQQRLLTKADVELAKSSLPILAGATKTVMKDLREYNFSEQALECMEELEINIVAELLIEIKDYHMVHLMAHDLCDAACLEHILQVLRENRIIDDQNDSLLYLFI